MDSAGNLYGASQGGCIEECNGTIFKLSPNQNGTWTESILYTFLGGTDGGSPTAIVLDGSGNIFGTTFSGGAVCSCGTVFELSPPQSGTTWQKTVLYSFNDGLGGGSPSSGVIFDGAGNLYGTTYDGGSFACPQSGCGVVYRLMPESGGWKFGVVYTFNGVNGSKGSQPSGGLTMDSAGNLYGTTSGGGNLTCNNGNGCGTVFKLSRQTGNNFTFSKIFEFNGTSGSFPNSGVIVDASGNFYGTTFTGGNPSCNCGVVFDITPYPTRDEDTGCCCGSVWSADDAKRGCAMVSGSRPRSEIAINLAKTSLRSMSRAEGARGAAKWQASEAMAWSPSMTGTENAARIGERNCSCAGLQQITGAVNISATTQGFLCSTARPQH